MWYKCPACGKVIERNSPKTYCNVTDKDVRLVPFKSPGKKKKVNKKKR